MQKTKNITSNLSKVFASYAAGLQYKDLPEHVVLKAKKLVAFSNGTTSTEMTSCIYKIWNVNVWQKVPYIFDN